MTTSANTTPALAYSDPIESNKLASHELRAYTPAERKALLNQLKNGDLTELEFDAVVFRAIYPNANCLRFHDDDMPRMAQSFGGQPFLRNHNTEDIDARDGTILSGEMRGQDLIQRIQLTTERGIKDYLQGRIDRFSIGWFYENITCSICHAEAMDCSHWPGRKYEVDGRQVMCELIFESPTGKETSAVNVPAVRGTHVLSARDGTTITMTGDSFLADICQHKLNHAPDPASAAPVLNAQEELAVAATTPTPILFEHTASPDSAPTPTPDPVPEPEPTPQVSTALLSSQETPHMELEEVNDGTTPVVTQPVVAVVAPIVAPAPLVAVPPPPAPVMPPTLVMPDMTEINQLKAGLRELLINGTLASSGLSLASQQAIRAALGPNPDETRLPALIEAQCAVEAALIERNVVNGMRPAYGGQAGQMIDSLDKFKLAFGALMEGKRPEKGIAPLSGIREAYIAMSGDYDMTGRWYGDRVQLSNVNTSTMADLMAEFLNMRVVRAFQSYEQFWRGLCAKEDFTSLHDPHWLVLGGIGELSDVAEGAAYTEKEWSVQTETTGWVKKGNWLGITLEAFDKDQTNYLQQAPRALAQAAYLSMGKAFTRLFTTVNGAGFGPTMRDGNPLFLAANHGNLGGTALSMAAWEATRIIMARQTEQGSGEVLGGLTVPRYVMVPRHLEGTAITAFSTERSIGNAFNDVSPFAESGESIEARRQAAKKRIIVNDFLGLANNWFAFADPDMFPLIGLGFRFGENPEIYSVADDKSGLMFTNDVMPIKIRFFFSMGPIDFRGVYRHTV